MINVSDDGDVSYFHKFSLKKSAKDRINYKLNNTVNLENCQVLGGLIAELQGKTERLISGLTNFIENVDNSLGRIVLE